MPNDNPPGPSDFGNGVEFVFEDMFSQDANENKQLEEIAANLQLRDRKRVFEFTAEADADQRRFIECPAKLIRLIAPAGSGKTQSIVNRVLSRVSKGQRLSQFLMLTFDNSASLSLSEKFRDGISSLSVPVADSPQVMTLNKFGYGLFRTILAERYNAFRIGENLQSDQRDAVRRTLKAFSQVRPDVYSILPSRLGYTVYSDLFSTFKNNLILSDTIFSSGRKRYLDWCKGNPLLLPWLSPLGDVESLKKVINGLALLYRHYCHIMVRHNRIDYEDQKLFPYLALAENDGLARAVSNQYCSIIVDEFQDINLLDFEFIRLVARDKELIVVGDDDQAIYAFRGCSPDYIVHFDEHMKRPVETHVLTVNYRCPTNIVDMSARLIEHNVDRIPKSPSAAKNTEADVKLWHCLNSASEAQVIARTIKRIYSELSATGFRYSDVAILLRMNSQSLPLQMALILEEIPYHCRKADNIIVSAAMERLLSLIGLHLKLRENPGFYSLPDSRLLCDCYFSYPREADVSLFHHFVEIKGNYKDGARATVQSPGYHKFKTGFATAVTSLLTSVQPVDLVLAIGDNFKNLNGIVGTLEDAIEDAVNDRLPLGELVDIAGRFRGDVHQFHEMLSGLLTKVQGGIFHAEEGDAVNLLTYFKAKGRQWHTVIIPGSNQKVIPSSRAKVEDERRLFYVAITRATHNLVVSYVRQAVRSAVEPSQFLKEMGFGKGDEKRANVNLRVTDGASMAPIPPSALSGSTCHEPEYKIPAVGNTEFLTESLVKILDISFHPGVVGTRARGSRMTRLECWRKAISCSPLNPDEILAALAARDNQIANADGPKAKKAIEIWYKFPNLAQQWKKDTAHLSNISKKALHPAYQEIIGMGKPAVPLLLAELRRELDDWFWALHAITGAKPVPEEDRGNVQKMADAWLKWGANQGYMA